MRLVKFGILLVVLLGLAACSYVDGNYPAPKTKPAALPDSWSNNGEPKPVIWERAPQLRGFYSEWVDLDAFAERLKMGADAGNVQAQEELEFVREIQGKDLAAFSIALFMDKETKQRLFKGQLRIEFADGTATQDEGLVFYEEHKSGPRRRTTLVGPQDLTAKLAKTGEPLMVRILVPKGYKGVTVTAVRLS